jgi:undecaprenyl-diphosphatase
MTPLHALLLGILEGLTEFLPVSSTGHLFLFGALLGHDDEATKALDIVMQLGAVIAVVVYYRARLVALVRGVLTRDPASLRLLVALFVAFLPAAVIGLAVHKKIKETLMAPVPIAGALVAGGILMVVIEAVRRRRGERGEEGLDKVTWQRALVIGFAQCFSLWPGASRSMSTIVGGQIAGLSTATAAEFSFFLAIPTLGAATLFDLYKHGADIVNAPGGAVALAVSMATSFVVSLVVIAAFLGYLKRHGLAPFGWYRIVFGAVVLAVMLRKGGAGSAEGHDARPPAAAVAAAAP